MVEVELCKMVEMINTFKYLFINQFLILNYEYNKYPFLHYSISVEIQVIF
jgi:hypothetical protein